MLYKGKPCEIVGEKEVFGEQIAWIRLLDDNSFLEVPIEDLKKSQVNYSISYLRYISIAAKIKDEVSKKNILAPYESSLIPLPHQILVLEKVMQSQQNRFLLADEVGMGKTIETGLILKELKIRGDIKRTLVIVPKSSMMQWQSELKNHFNEVFHIYDSEMITSMARMFSNINADEEFNFWTQHNQIIVSTDALKPLEKRHGWSQERIDEYNKYRMAAVLEADFDMVIIDEAHKMGGASASVSRYILAQELCNSVPNILLLTATPHRGKEDHFRRILQLLDPDAFAGEGLPDIAELEPYVIRTEKRFAVDYDGNKLFSQRQTYRFDVFLDINKHQKQMALYDAVTDYVRKGFNTAKRTKNNATGLIMILFQRLVSSSTAAILSAMKGRLERLRLGEGNEPEDFSNELDSDVNDYDQNIDYEHVYQYDPRGFEDEEALLTALIEKAEDCIQTETDAKAEALNHKYLELQRESNDPNFKIIVFTEFRTTQKMLCEFLRAKGYKVTFIHGGQDIDERRKSLLQFRDEAQILVATDAAGESLNMQFCNVVINYDLPWNPMMIEQRIGRVDRIGQKKDVQAYNMLTSNSVDLRVYEVIEEKLNNIIEQFGIDKTSDVLDSALDLKKVNMLYLQSLLNPERFDFAGDQWLHEIKAKLSEYKSTEGALPHVQESEIDYKKAAEIKHSPLVYWLEAMIEEYTTTQKGRIIKNKAGYSEAHLDGIIKKISFDAEVSLDNPRVEHLSLQHDWVREILKNISAFDTKKGVPVIISEDGDDISGYWSLWEIVAKNTFETKTRIQALFIADNGKQYTAYANDIWNRLVAGSRKFRLGKTENSHDKTDMEKILNESLYIVFQNLKAEILDKMEVKKDNRINSYNFQKSRVQKIGIDNIRHAKLSRLKKEQEVWIEKFNMDNKVIPSVKQLLSLRWNG